MVTNIEIRAYSVEKSVILKCLRKYKVSGNGKQPLNEVILYKKSNASSMPKG